MLRVLSVDLNQALLCNRSLPSQALLSPPRRDLRRLPPDPQHCILHLDDLRTPVDALDAPDELASLDDANEDDQACDEEEDEAFRPNPPASMTTEPRQKRPSARPLDTNFRVPAPNSLSARPRPHVSLRSKQRRSTYHSRRVAPEDERVRLNRACASLGELGVRDALKRERRVRGVEDELRFLRGRVGGDGRWRDVRREE